MDFTIPEEIQSLRQRFHRFLDTEVLPLEERLGPEVLAGERSDGVREAIHALRARSWAEGYYGAHLPEAVGGRGLSHLAMGLLIEDAARSGMRLALFVLGPPHSDGPAPILLRLPRQLQEAYLRPLVSGEITTCVALSEPDVGSDLPSIHTTARREGDSWIINGIKQYVTGGAEAAFALVLAVTDPARRTQGGMTLFLVPRHVYRVGRAQPMLGGVHPTELIFEEARVPCDHVVGEVGFGFFEIMRHLSAGRYYIGCQCIGLAEYGLAQAVGYARQRQVQGSRLLDLQAVSFPLAECRIEIEAMRWLTYHLAWQLDQQMDCTLESSMAKFFDTERAFAILDRCLQVMGAQGMLRDGSLEAIFRYLRTLRVVEGPSEVHKHVVSRWLALPTQVARGEQ